MNKIWKCIFPLANFLLLSKKRKPVPRFQGTPARLLSIRTVGGQSGKTRENEVWSSHIAKKKLAARVSYISLVFSNAHRVLSRCNIRLRLLHLLNRLYSTWSFIMIHFMYTTWRIWVENTFRAHYMAYKRTQQGSKGIFDRRKILTVWIWAILLCKRKNNTRKHRVGKLPYVVFIFIAKFKLPQVGFACRWRVKLLAWCRCIMFVCSYRRC